MPQRLKELLRERSMSQSELARRMKVRDGTISDILSGKTVPNTDTLSAMCDVLDAYPSYVMLGLGPKWRSDSLSELEAVQLPEGARATHGVDQWLADHSDLSEDERAWMRAVPWPVAHVRQPDLVYLTVLSAYRQAREAKPVRLAVVQPDGRRP